MCGIAGIVGKSHLVQEPVLKTMAQKLAHRGPDDEGVEIVSVEGSNNFSMGLVHRRLSIIDLSKAAHQPMRDEQTGNWIVYNGEIYNFKDIQSELKAKGYRFNSNSDTEVILKAYAASGIDCLKKFVGMFAFAIWDNKKKILFLVVDRFGIKPLYCYKGENGLFAFASEVRAILHSGIAPKKVDPLAVDSFLAYGAIQAPLTIVKGVESLLPAHYLLYDCDTNTMVSRCYWSLAHLSDANHLSDEKKAIEGLRGLLDESIKKHLVSDVPVGLFLSGGVDSSSVVALANELDQGRLRSFSITFSESEFSEEKYSQLIARRYCKHHAAIKLSQSDLLSLLPQAISAMDQPTIDGINVYAISKAVRESGIKAVLSGQGGDEVFGGYTTFPRIPLIQRIYNVVQFLPLSVRQVMGEIIDGVTGRLAVRSKIAQILESDGSIFSIYLILRQLLNPRTRAYLRRGELNEDLLNGVPFDVAESLIDEMKTFDVFNKISLLELRLYLGNTLLRDGDFMSMAHGLEIRVPFLQHELVEYVFRVSTKFKMSPTLPKPLLVNAMGEMLPEEIYRRPKMGFTFPWENWLRDKLRSQVEELFNGLPSDNEMGLNVKHCQSLWEMFLQKKGNVSWPRVWAIYVLLQWYRENM